MVIGLLTARLCLNGVRSLKAKRSIVKGLTGRLKSRFNISVSEVDHQDSHVSAVIAMSLVSNDGGFVDRQFDAILEFMKRDGSFYLGRVEREFI